MPDEVCRHSYEVERVDGVTDLLDLAASDAAREPLWYFERPGAGDALLAIGQAHVIRTSGARRLSEAQAAALAVLDALEPKPGGGKESTATDTGAPAPRFVGGFAFADDDPGDGEARMWREFPACLLVLPRRLWILKADECWLVRTSPCEAARAAERHRSALAGHANGAATGEAGERRPGDRERWIGRVERVLSMVAAGEVEKVVLSRRRMLDCDDAVSRDRLRIARTLRELRDARPGCFTFWASPGATHFFGSTPELLVRKHGRLVESQALAGTVRRGTTHDEDDRLAAALARSVKDRHEQEAVTRSIEQALRPVTSSLEVAPRPALLAVPEAYHLHTPIRGCLNRPTGALELAAMLHPTPSVCGAPREVARRLLEAEERERGWYTGAIGWLGAGGDGELAVALRAALVDGAHATVWAGAGIVDGSDPAAEFDETEVKMRALRGVLEGLHG